MKEKRSFLLIVKKQAPVFLFGLLVGALLCRLSDTFMAQTEVVEPDVKGVQAREVDEQESIECNVYVDVGGAVAKPGVYCLKSGERLVNAVKLAGGFVGESYASKYVSRYLNLALPLKEDQKIYIPYQNDLQCSLIPYEQKAEEEKEVVNRINSGEEKEDLEVKEEEAPCVSINTAGKSALMSVSGVGESMAQKIIDGRPYKELEDLKNISGVGDTTFEKFRPHICL